ncbi:hypothetical protein SDC9_185101 [bioreactor metagenome]|uniref:Uncharacterized protein n=1 Tax=bioreactor metagenome TaxID=1076179 RepID=A0A645HEZ3_9ZZZZ
MADAGVFQRFNDRHIGIGQLNVFADQAYTRFLNRIFKPFHKTGPFLHIGPGGFFQIKIHLRKHHLIQLLLLHIQRNTINGGSIYRLHDGLWLHVTE